MLMWIRNVSPRVVLGVRGLDVVSSSPGGDAAGGFVEDSAGVLVAGIGCPASLGGASVPHAARNTAAVAATAVAVTRRTMCIGSPSGLDI
jgi:hypothetical protein